MSSNKSTNKERELERLLFEIQKKNEELERNKDRVEKQNLKSRERTIELFGKMIDLKKAKKIISIQNEELEHKNIEINRKRLALERTYKKFRQRTIELFGKMVDLRKAYNIINTQKKEIEDQRRKLHELNASKDKFFSIVAHDLKNPIAGFLGLTEVMAQDMGSFSDAEKQEFIDLLHKSSKQLYSLLENLLQWSRAQTGRLAFNPDEIKLTEIVAENFSLIKTNAEVKGVKLLNLVEDKLNVYADRDMLNTIFRNLLSNAIKFSNKGEIVKVKSFVEGSFAFIDVEDMGVGIGEEDQEKLFKIEYNTSKIGTAKEKGTGLGLILCHEFVHRNNGEIKCISELNKGTTFRFSIPIAEKLND